MSLLARDHVTFLLRHLSLARNKLCDERSLNTDAHFVILKLLRWRFFNEKNLLLHYAVLGSKYRVMAINRYERSSLDFYIFLSFQFADDAARVSTAATAIV